MAVRRCPQVLANEYRPQTRQDRLHERLAGLAMDEHEDLAAERIWVVEALHRLSDADQEVLRLSAWEDLTGADIAAVLNCSNSAAAVRLHRARQRLRMLMSQDRRPDDARQHGGRPWLTRSSCSGGSTPPGSRGQRSARRPGARRPAAAARRSRVVPPDRTAPFVPVPLARARTVRRREPVPVATGKRWTTRRRSTLAGAATVALVLAVLALSTVLAPGRGGPPPAFAATPPILRAVSTVRAPAPCWATSRASPPRRPPPPATCAGSATSTGRWPTASTAGR